MLIKKCINIFKYRTNNFADPSGRAVWGVGLRLLVCWDSGLEVYVTGQSLVQASPTKCGVICEPQQRGGVGPSGAVRATKKKYLAHEVITDVTGWLYYVILRKKTIHSGREVFTVV